MLREVGLHDDPIYNAVFIHPDTAEMEHWPMIAEFCFEHSIEIRTSDHAPVGIAAFLNTDESVSDLLEEF